MRHAQVVTFGLENRLTERLQPWCESRSVWLRPTQHAHACLNLLRAAGAGVLVMRLGRDVEKELQLLERASTLFPDASSIVVGSGEHPALAGLAWDLGASCVLLPLPSLTELQEALTLWLPPSKTP
jgi:hypothetical protein